MQASSPQRINRYTLGRAALVAGSYFLIARAAMWFAVEPERVSILWLPSGIALAALVLAARHERAILVAAIFLASIAAHLTSGHTPLISLGLAVTQVLEAMAGAWVLARWASQPLRFEHLRDSVMLILVVVTLIPLCALVNAALIATTIQPVLINLWLAIFFANGLGALLLAPVIIVWVRRGMKYQPITWFRFLEGLGVLGSTILLSLIVFAPQQDPLQTVLLRPYLLMPMLVWFALGFSPRGTSVALLVISTLGLTQTFANHSNLTTFSLDDSLQMLSTQAFLGIISGSVLILSTTFAERVRADRALTRYKLLVENSRDMILFVRRSNGKIIEVNQAALDTFGYTRDEMIGMEIGYLRPPESRQEISGLMRRADAGGVRYETTNLRKDGTSFAVEVSSRTIEIDGERVLFNIVRDISERKHAEQAQREAEARYYALFEQTQDAVFLLDLHGNHIAANQRAADMLGYTHDEMQKLSLRRTSAQIEESERVLQRLLSGEQIRPYERLFHRKDGTILPVEINVALIRNGDGQPAHIQSMVRDISERKKNLEALQRHESYLRAIMNNVPFELWLKDTQGKYLAVNQLFLKTNGYPHVEDIVGKTDFDLWSAEIARKYRAEEIHVIKTRQQTEHEKFVNRNGIPHWYQIHTLPIWDDQEHIIGTVGAAQDITEWKQTQQAIQDSENLYRSLVTVMPDGVALSDLNGIVTFASPHLIAMHGGAPDTRVEGMNALQWIAPEYRAKAVANMQALLGNDQLETDNHYVLLRQDGSRFAGEIDAAVLRDEQGNPRSMVTIHRDVTARQQMEDALRTSEEKFRKLFEGSADPFFLLDAKTGQFLDANPAACQLYGYTHQELLGLSSPDLSAEPEKSRQSLETNETYVPLRWHRKKDGTRFPTELNISYLTLNNRLVRLSAVRDITERQRAADALRESEARYRSLFDEMLNGFALHEIICDANGLPCNYRFLEINPAFERMTGLSAATAIGKTVTELLPGIESHWINMYGRVALTGEPAHFENYTAPLDKYFEVTVFCPKPGQFATVFADITSRRQAELALRESEQQFRQILENVSLIAVRLDNHGDIVFCNDWFLNLTGWTREEVMGKNWFTTFMPPERPEFQQLSETIATGTVPVHFENEIITHAGKRRLVSWSNTIAHDTAGTIVGVTSIGEDVTERRQREVELEAIVAMNTALRRARSRAEMLPIILDQASQLFHTDGVIVGMFDPNTGEAHVEQANGVWQTNKGFRTPAGKGISGYLYTSRQPYITHNLADDPLLYHPEMIQGIQSSINMPLATANQVLGWITIGSRTHFADADMRVLHAIADLIANAMHRADLFEQTNQNITRLTALNMIDRTINASLDLRVTLNILLDQVITQLGADATSLLLFNRQTQMLECRAERGFRYVHTIGSLTRLGNDVTSRAVLERQLVSLPDLSIASDSIARGNTLAREGFVSYYAVPLVSKGYVKGVLEVFHRTPFTANDSWVEFLRSLGEQAAIAVDNAELFTSLQRSNDELTVAYDATIEGWSRALDLRDKETEGHTLRVTEMTIRLAHALGLADEELTVVRRGALLHDIGKVGISDTILLKAGPLEPGEWEIMRLHPIYAYDLLAPITYLRPSLHIPYCHHEKWDGTGYPRGLRGEQIPLHARMFAIVDVWDALSHDRPYRAAWPKTNVMTYLKDQAGKHFEPAMTDVFLKLLESS